MQKYIAIKLASYMLVATYMRLIVAKLNFFSVPQEFLHVIQTHDSVTMPTITFHLITSVNTTAIQALLIS